MKFPLGVLGVLGVLVVKSAAQGPEYIPGDECLFCHRNDIGPGWRKNRHGITIRQREDAPDLAANAPADVEFFLGSRKHVRYLKKQGYGKFSIRAVSGGWDTQTFANRCAGCHATAVDPATKTFAAFGLDCYACHGNVNLQHTNDTSLIWLSKKRRDDVRAVTSICAQCHLRGGKSRTTGLPYPNNFVAGDNLFKDYQADFAKADDASLNPGDRHVWRNVRDVLVNGSIVTCLNCHRVHANSSARHRLVLRAPICFDCHYEKGPFKAAKPYTVSRTVCEY